MSARRQRARTGPASGEFVAKKRLRPFIGLLRQCGHRAAAAAREGVIGVVLVDRDQRIVLQRSADLGLGLGWREFVARRDMQQQRLADVLSFAQQIVETDAVVADRGIAVGAGGAEKGEPPTQAIADHADLEHQTHQSASDNYREHDAEDHCQPAMETHGGASGLLPSPYCPTDCDAE